MPREIVVKICYRVFRCQYIVLLWEVSKGLNKVIHKLKGALLLTCLNPSSCQKLMNNWRLGTLMNSERSWHLFRHNMKNRVTLMSV